MKTNPFQTNFTAGELSERLDGRVDISRYANGLRTVENFIVQPHGGVTRRPGTQFIAAVKNHAHNVRLLPFEFSDEQAYVLELGNQYIRFYMNGGRIESPPGTPVEVVSPYAHADLAAIQYVQSADVMYLFHVDYPTQKLSRTSHTAWTLTEVEWVDGPYLPKPQNREVSTVTASAGHFQTVDTNQDGWGDTGNTDASTQLGGGYVDKVVAGIEDPAGATTRRDFRPLFTFDGVPVDRTIYRALVRIHQVAETHVGAYPLRLDYMSAVGMVSGPSNYEVTAREDLGTVVATQETKWVEIDVTGAVQDCASKGEALIRFRLRPIAIPLVGTDGAARYFTFDGFGSGNSPVLEVDYDNGITITPSAVKGTITLTASDDLFEAGHVGALWSITHGATRGYVRITDFTSATEVEAEVLLTLGGTRATGVWAEGAFSEKRGYPRTGTFHEDRLQVAATRDNPQTIWGSQSGDYENMEAGDEDADATIFTINSSKVNVIRWLVSANRGLLIGTLGSAHIMDGGGPEPPITPSNVNVRVACKYGTDIQAPVEVEHAVLFVQRSGKKVRELAFDFGADTYVAPDLSILSEHIANRGIKETAFQPDREPVVWCVLDDGVLAGMTYERSHEVVGWHRHITDGAFESVVSIPHPDGDRHQTWFVVRRTIGGATKRYIEHLQDFDGWYTQLMVDSGLTYFGPAVSSVSGLDHLEGKTVDIVGDGVVYPQKVVTAGEVTLDPAATVIEVGLPFDSTLATLRPEAQGAQGGSIQAMTKRWAKVIPRFLSSLGGKINGKPIVYRRAGEPMDTVTDPFTGDVELTNLGYSKLAPIVILQDQPLPMTVLGITGILDANTV